MIKNPEILKKFEDDFMRKSSLPYGLSMKIFEAMWKEAVTLGIFPLKERLEGVEVDIKVAKILNSCLKNSSQK